MGLATTQQSFIVIQQRRNHHANEKQQNIKIQTLPIFLLIAAVLAFITIKRGETAHEAGLLVADGGFGGTLEIIEHDVGVTVNNGITGLIAAVYTLFKSE